MLKFAYVVSLAFVSFLLFIFSKEKRTYVCKNDAIGTITLITDSVDNYLGIVTKENKVLRPVSMNEDVVLAAGQKVSVCFNIDSTNVTTAIPFTPVHIESISYYP